MKDLDTVIDTTEFSSRVFIDKFDDETVWLSLQVMNGGARCTMTFDQAREMIAALTKIVEGE